mgnify:CR=1 FL=1
MNKKTILILSCMLISLAFAAGFSMAKSGNGSKAYAGMQLEVINNLQKYGVAIEDASKPQFNTNLVGFFSAPKSLTDALNKFSIVLRNDSPQQVMAMTVIWKFYPSAGQPITQSFTQIAMDDIFNNTSHNLIGSGGLRGISLLAQNGGFGTPTGQITEIKDDEWTQAQLARLNTLLSHSVRWSVEIDGALLSNGLYVGLDATSRFAFLQAKIQGARDMINELALKAGDPGALVGFAQEAAKVTMEDLEKKFPDVRTRMKNPEYAYAQSRRQIALRTLAERETNGGNTAAVDFIQAGTRNQIAIVRKTS